jgi:hypothetical protein
MKGGKKGSKRNKAEEKRKGGITRVMIPIYPWRKDIIKG